MKVAQAKEAKALRPRGRIVLTVAITETSQEQGKKLYENNHTGEERGKRPDDIPDPCDMTKVN